MPTTMGGLGHGHLPEHRQRRLQYRHRLRDVSFTLQAQSCLGIFGPSGSGKSTLLSAIAGNLPYRGAIMHEGRDLAPVKPWRRPFRYLNQRLYLFPYITVENNLRLAQYAAGLPYKGAAAQKKRRGMLGELGILHLAGRHPGGVSGGEQQRAALADSFLLLKNEELINDSAR